MHLSVLRRSTSLDLKYTYSYIVQSNVMQGKSKLLWAVCDDGVSVGWKNDTVRLSWVDVVTASD